MRSQPIIKAKALELIAKEIGDMDTGSNLVELLTNCGVERELIHYPNTKWRMVYSVLIILATSPNPKNQETLFKIIEEAVHPLMYNGNEKTASQCEKKFNNLLKYDNFVLKKGKLKKIDQQSEPEDEEDDEEEEDDNFDYDGISSPYENTELELFIMKKILLEYEHRDDSGFCAKELSFNNNSLKEICEVINKLIEDHILYLSANTRPESFENEEGIEDKSGFINWNMVEKLDKNSQEMDIEDNLVIFDTDVTDEVKLKGRIDIAIEKFMNDKIYIELGYLMDKDELEKQAKSIRENENYSEYVRESAYNSFMPKNITYPYAKQREIVYDEIFKNDKEELVVPLNNFRDKKVDILKTLLALEKENLLRIKELRSNPMYDEKGNFLGKWSTQDNPFAKIQVLKIYPHKQDPMLLKIIEMPEVKIRGFEEKVVLQKQNDNFRCSPDYRKVWSGDKEFNLTTNQARVIELLNTEREAGKGSLSQGYILETLEIGGQNLAQVFRRSSAWNKLVIRASGRGMYQLNLDAH